MKAAVRTHKARIQRVLDHIDQHLDRNLELEALSDVAAYSKYHFHRRFTAALGMTVHRYVQMARLKQASHELARTGGDRVTDIAIGAGYDAPDAFARAFRRRFGQSPSSFRKSPDWEPWLVAFGPFDNARSRLMQIIFENQDVTIRNVAPTRVAIMEHRGDRARLAETIQRYRDWCRDAGMTPETSSSFMVFRSERNPENAADYSMDLCVGTNRDVPPGDGPMKAGLIPGGRCAVLRYPGNTNNLEPAALYLLREWLPASGEQAGDFPIYCQRRLAPIPGTSLQEVVVELFLPLRS